MHTYTKVTLSGGSLAALLTLTACAGTVSASGTAGSSAAPSATPSSAATSAAASPSSSAGSSGSGSGSSGSSGSSGTSTCQTSDLKIEPGIGTGPNSDQGQTDVSFNVYNTSTITCSMYGFPGVDLVGTLNGQQSRISVGRAASTIGTVTLQPGQDAGFTIKYRQQSGTGSFDTTTMVVTPPNTYNQMTYPLKIDIAPQGSGYLVSVSDMGYGGHP